MLKYVLSGFAFLLLFSGCGGGGSTANDVKGDAVLKQIHAEGTIYDAAKSGDLATVKQLIDDHKWDPQSLDSNGMTPLCCAAAGGNTEIIKLMVQNGADANGRGLHGVTPLQSAQKAGKTEAVAVLKELGATE